MIKKMLGVFTSVIAALAVVGVAWAGTDDATPTSVTAAGETSSSVSIDDSSSSTDATIASSTDATVASSTEATVDSSTSTSIEDRDDDSTTSTSIDDRDDDTTTSTTIDSTTSTSIDDRDDDTTTSTTIDSTTSTSFDDSDSRVVPDGVNTYQIPGVGAVTIEVVAGRLVLVNVSAPGWEIEEQRVEADRVELELVSGEAEAEFRARVNNGEIEVRIEVD